MTDTSYATVTELKGFSRTTLTTMDDEMQIALNAAARAIDRWCNRDTGLEATEAFIAETTASAREFVGDGGQIVRVPDFVTVTVVETKDSPYDASTDYETWPSTDYRAFSGLRDHPNFTASPFSGLMVDLAGDRDYFPSGKVGGFGAPTVRITAKWGYATVVPQEIKMACIAQAMRWLKRAEGGMHDAVGSPEFGMLLFTKSVDPDISQMLTRFWIPAVG